MAAASKTTAEARTAVDGRRQEGLLDTDALQNAIFNSANFSSIATDADGVATTVLRAHSGQEAIDLARLQLPDVIVLDLMMPEVNGFDVVEALNEHPDTARIPLLVVTAKEITDEDRAKLHGYVAAVMEKADFNSERFATEVRRATSKRTVVA